jgi:hypothetical protein
MKMVKSLLLGSAAGLVAMAGAQAADLPVKAKPVQYVKICSLYGAGFYYIPGTDTCLKVGGYMRAEVNYHNGGSGSVPGTLVLNNRDFRNQDWRTRAAITLDARSQTAYGTLRSYTFISATSDESGSSNSGFPGVNQGASASAYVRIYAPAACIQLAGFTFGKTNTFFAFDGANYSNQTVYWLSDQGGNGVQVFAYTAQFGNGLSASLSAENNNAFRQGIVNAGTVTGYAAETWPDIVGNLRVDQAWGGAQIMGAIHNVNAVDTVGTLHPSDEIGYAIGGGLKFNLPMLGAGDYVQGQVTYAKGALRYLTGNQGLGPLQTVADGDPISSVAYGPAVDAVVTGAAPGTLDLTTGWTVTAGYEHRWNPMWKTSLWGDYGKIRYSSTASAALPAVAATGIVPAAAFVDGDWSLFQIGSRTVWTPVENFDLSVEVIYNKMNGATTTSPLASADQDWFSGMFRVQRNFWP